LDVSEWSRTEFLSGWNTVDVSAAALLIDGVLYVQSVGSRGAGPFPYPQSMRHGVFSVTKTLGMGLSMFYLAQEYGERLFDALITDYVPALARHPGWSGVTLEDALGMATGTHGGDTGDDIVPFIRARTAADKLAAVGQLPDSPPRPGEVFNYASTNFFVLSYALNQYVKARAGPDADYWLMLREDVLRPLGIENLPIQRTIERDGELGTPIMGWGSYPNVDEAAKIAQLLRDEGLLRGRQLLNRNKVREALHRTSVAGYDAGNGQRYLHSVWLMPADAGPCRVQVPTMNGHGGNQVSILPSGLIAIRFGDMNNYDINPLVRTAERYRSSCR
jgi:CubicO group peptidase (beta-lactamase class C family)